MRKETNKLPFGDNHGITIIGGGDKIPEIRMPTSMYKMVKTLQSEIFIDTLMGMLDNENKHHKTS